VIYSYPILEDYMATILMAAAVMAGGLFYFSLTTKTKPAVLPVRANRNQRKQR
jgi:hypothetical protein